jgi:hypothetical protein
MNVLTVVKTSNLRYLLDSENKGEEMNASWACFALLYFCLIAFYHLGCNVHCVTWQRVTSVSEKPALSYTREEKR